MVMRTPVKEKIDRTQATAKPFLKWAGGKQQLLPQLEPLFPQKFHRYIEPFVGGGAVFFHLWNSGRLPKEVYLFDSNEELINTYLMVRDEVDKLIDLLTLHREKHSREYYYFIRNLDRKPSTRLSDVERAARTIYLNKTCYNGLYRVNSKGQFNVPMGRYKNPAILNAELLRAASLALQGVNLKVLDFRRLPEISHSRDFIYFDPPYDPISKSANFTSYTRGNFNDADQQELARVFRELNEKGCYCMLSNSHTPFILELYRGFRIEVVQAPRTINANANGRGSVKEVVVVNYD